MQLTVAEAQLYYSPLYKTIEIPGVKRVYTNVHEINLAQKRVYFLDNNFISLDEFIKHTGIEIVEDVKDIKDLRQMYLENVLNLYSIENPRLSFYLQLTDEGLVYVDKQTGTSEVFSIDWITNNLKINLFSQHIPNFKKSKTFICDILTFINIAKSKVQEINLIEESCLASNVWIPFDYIFQLFLIPGTYILLKPLEYNFQDFANINEFVEWYGFKILSVGKFFELDCNGIKLKTDIPSIEKWFGCRISDKRQVFLYPLHFARYVYEQLQIDKLFVDDDKVYINNQQVQYVDIQGLQIKLNTNVKEIPFFRQVELVDYEDDFWYLKSVEDKYVELVSKKSPNIKVKIKKELFTTETGVVL